jgi:hypothetical protein
MTRFVRSLFLAATLSFILTGPALTAPPPAPAGLTNAPQGWSAAERVAWYTATQGSRLIPLAWLRALEQPNTPERPNNTALFLDPDHIQTFRYLPNPTAGFTTMACATDKTMPLDKTLPLGFTVDCQSDKPLSNTKLRWKTGQSDREPWVGLNCSACHTNDIRYGATTIRVDGAPTLADFQGFTDALELAMRQTASNKDKFNRFAEKLLAGTKSPQDDPKMLAASLKLWNDWYGRLAVLNDPSVLRYGFGRLDAIGHIFNKVSLIATPDNIDDQIANPADAPVSYPFLWNVPQLNKVEWNGSAPNIDANDLRAGALVRNTGEVIGVFADIVIKPKAGRFDGYVSSINLPYLVGMETRLTKLRPPAWPAIFPPIDQPLADAGRGLFKRDCAGCHTIPTAPGSLTEKFIVNLQPAINPVAGHEPVGTDMWMACNAVMATARSGRFQGNLVTFLSLSETIPATADSFTLTGNAAVGALLGRKAQLASNAITGIFGFAKDLPLPGSVPMAAGLDRKQSRAQACRDYQEADSSNPKMVYKGRPLQGIWATAPYMHNGAVANLWEMLLPPAQRMKEFYLGTREFDPVLVGFKSDKATPGNEFRFRTQDDAGVTIEGNANAGHDYGNARLTEPQRRALVEYMKTL